jgi:hypothetical protein
VEANVREKQWIGGTIILVLAALVFLLAKGSGTIPVAITLTVVGLIMVTTTKKRTQSYDG